ncbi:conserved unknown protein [Ectocarpus siliculosus]|uniref:Uncharacterized protein n=1 Tax=Ectocarpus siliculosus TaxID=2880 RepID=D7G5D8_ECTSI|nr:conserved unknown protein [Ectocarpus siliculosus]|eukprot:CBJ33832.1 conserved unknown protein [Ectocarpus siliculosus]
MAPSAETRRRTIIALQYQKMRRLRLREEEALQARYDDEADPEYYDSSSSERQRELAAAAAIGVTMGLPMTMGGTRSVHERRCRMRLPPGGAAPSACATTSTTTNPSPDSAAPPTVSASPSSSLWPSTADLVDGILAGSRASLSRAITLVESHRLDHRRQAELLLDRLLSARHQAGAPPPPPASQPPPPPPPPPPPEESVTDSASGGSCSSSLSTPPDSGTAAAAAVAEGLASSGRRDCSSGRLVAATGGFPKLGMRLGIAGPPGAGKSSFIEVLGKRLTSAGNRVAVISIDPSSLRTGGSILGDKTRMDELSRDPSAFVRGCPARGVLGGLSRYTHEVVLLCQVAGYDPVIVETVGLGQNEVVLRP